MLTKKQVFEAALKYAQEQNPGVSKAAVEPYEGFIAGAMWAANEMGAESKKIEREYAQIAERNRALEDRYAKTAISLVRSLDEALELRKALEDVIDRYEVANMLAGDDPVIEKAKKALK